MSDVRGLLRLPFRFSRGLVLERFAQGLRRGAISGARCEVCDTVFVPPRAFCSRCWEPITEWVPVADTGDVVTYVVVNVPFPGQQVAIPYVLATILLDGAGTTILHLLGTTGNDGTLHAPANIAIGMRVGAVWSDDRTGALNDDVDHFEPVLPT